LHAVGEAAQDTLPASHGSAPVTICA
jgi:hypothetical protein